MRAFNIQQNTPEWLRVRCGRVTASRMGDVMAKRKRGESELAVRKNYRKELRVERLTNRSYDHYVSPEMDRGHEQEKFARAAYEIATEQDVDQIGFIVHSSMDFYGASPDSLVGINGGLEMKNPNTATHLDWRDAGIVPPEYEPQMMANIDCGEREWWDFMSYDDRLPPGLRIFIARLYRDEKRIAEMRVEAERIHAEVEFMCMQLGAPPWYPIMPAASGWSVDVPSARELTAGEEMVSVGSLSIPKDLSEMLDAAELIP